MASPDAFTESDVRLGRHMSLTTGASYLARLNDGREVWADGERIEDVARHPGLTGCAESIASLYDLQHAREHAHLLSSTAPDVPEPIPRSYYPPRSAEEVRTRGLAFNVWAARSLGLLGRSPDYMNAGLMALSTAHRFFAKNGNRAGAGNLIDYYRFAREHDLHLSHAFASLQLNRGQHRPATGHHEIALRVVDSHAGGVVVRGSRGLATLAPLADELVSFGSGRNLGPGDGAFAIAFAIPVSTPGLKFVCRQPFSVGHAESSPLAFWFDEIDAVAIFDDVTIPWERVFIYQDVELVNGFKAASHFYSHVGHHVLVRSIVKCEFVLALAAEIAHVIGVSEFLSVRERLGEMAMYVETLRACVHAAECAAVSLHGDEGVFAPSPRAINAGLRQVQVAYPRMIELLRSIGASGFITLPSAPQAEGPLRAQIDDLYRGDDRGGIERIRLFRLAWELVGSAFGARQLLFEEFALGEPVQGLARRFQEYDATALAEVLQRALSYTARRPR